MTRRLASLVLFVWAQSAGVAVAQTPPSAAELTAYTGLHAAAAHGDAKEIVKLIAGGADPNSRDRNGRTPLHVAVHRSKQEAARALVRGGADPRALDGQRYDAITIAAVKDDVETMRLAIELGGDAKAITSPYDGTALIAAAHLGHDEVARVLIAAGAPLDHVNNLGWTALIEAIVLGDGGQRHTACVQALLDAGDNPNLADRSGHSPLRLAGSRGYGEMARLIEAKGGR
jgi:ankyrin repeat protein